MYAMIMAGGGGTRLWPHSRIKHPKQFVDIIGQHTLVQKSYERIRPLVPPENIYVVTGKQYVDLIHDQLPDLAPENLITEPEARNTAPAIGLGAAHIQHRDPEGVMIVLTADHLIRKNERFRSAVSAGAKVAESGALVTLGIQPNGPATGFGYIEQGDALDAIGEFEVFEVVRFTEKPDLNTAIAFFASERYHWNSGMFIWRVDRIMAEFARQMPDLHNALEAIGAALGTPEAAEVTARVWQSVPRMSIDYGIMEGAENVAVVPIDIGWSDVGSWAALYDEAARAPGDNVVKSGELLAIDTEGCLVQSDKLVTTVGLRDLVIVDTRDVLMLCPRERTQEVREIVRQLKTQKRSEYL